MRSERARRALPPLLATALLAAAPAEAQEWRTVTAARQHQGETGLEVRVTYGAGDLRVRPAPAALLYRMELRHDERQTRAVSEYDREAGRLRLGVEGRRRNARAQRGGHATVELSPRVPLDLRLEFGAGRAEVDLGGMAVRSLELATGASDTELRWASPNRAAAGEVRIVSGASRLRVRGLGNARAERIRYEGGVGEAVLDFDGSWSRNADVAVEMGMGAVTLRFPRSLGVRIENRSTLSRFSPAGMERRGDAWYSPGWERARSRVTVRVDAALGAVNVQWID
jgi:hypothetical protein